MGFEYTLRVTKLIYLISPIFIALLLVSPQLFAECEVWEIIEMVDEGADRMDVKDACNNQVSDAPSCKATRVFRYYDDRNMDEEEILLKCGGQGQEQGQNGGGYATICVTNYGNCQMRERGPIGVVCNCNGMYPGITQ